jgi:hypothetical protein
MTLNGKDVDTQQLFTSLGKMEAGIDTLKEGQEKITEEVKGIKTNCEGVSSEFNDRIGKLEQVKTAKEIKVGSLTMKGYQLDEVIRKAVWIAILYLVLESVGVVPEDLIKHIIKREPVVAAEVR